ncbi:energy-coupling factor ABC transporter ATP-binding protein [Psychromonas sp. psych-6C06]|uniref:energy-coupling factor ABC transporter ATP-binding protein n=1 Tax=Psychromonas sp. psych-6C06 TaxID=2058089 RepID=UPI000C3296C6|nr:ABC transporter ATP-binding protein [Psychromonas sp. psych-6C06]PKF61593.1 energy-coupling factor ABC transporter ATP-binding protein [Psychromonas sp. psych-6C06]
MENTNKALLEIANLSYAYPKQNKVLNNIHFVLNRHERVVINGDNGAGKTTLLHLIVGLKKAKQGEIIAFGEHCKTEKQFNKMRVKAGLVFQDPDDQLFCPTVLEDVMFGPLNLGFSKQQAIKKSLQTLDSLGLKGFESRITHQLSGGEKRLVTLASVLVMQPEVLILDEPTNALDEKAKIRLLHVLKALPQAMIIISHDKDFSRQLATRELCLHEGRLSESSCQRNLIEAVA